MAASGATATVNYTGWLYSDTAPDNKGKQFDTSIGRGPFSFRLKVSSGVVALQRSSAFRRLDRPRRAVKRLLRPGSIKRPWLD